MAMYTIQWLTEAESAKSRGKRAANPLGFGSEQSTMYT